MDPWPRLILSGHAKLPQDSAARAIYEILTVVVAVDPTTARVIDAETTLVTRPAREFVTRLLTGVSLDESPRGVLDVLDAYYWGGAKKALAAAIYELYDKWRELKGSAQTAKRPVDPRRRPTTSVKRDVVS